MTDEIYNAFKNYVTNLESFRFESQSQDQFRKLKAAAQREEYYKLAEEAFKALEVALTPNVGRDLDNFREEVSELLSMELLRRYYYQRGAIIFNIARDKEINEATRVLSDKSEYRDMLNGTILTHAGDKRMSGN